MRKALLFKLGRNRSRVSVLTMQSSREPNAVEPGVSLEKIECTSPGLKTEEELPTSSELVKPSEASELETDHKQLAADTGEHQREERNVDEPPINTVTDHEITSMTAEEEFKDQKNEISASTEPENASEPTQGGSCSTCSEFLVWNPATQEHQDVTQEVLLLRTFYGQAESTNEEPVKREDPEMRHRSADVGICRDYIVPDENGLIFKGKRPLVRYGCANWDWERPFKGKSRESAVSMPPGWVPGVTHTKPAVHCVQLNNSETSLDESTDNESISPLGESSTKVAKRVANTDTQTEPAVTEGEYWVEEDKDALRSKDEDGELAKPLTKTVHHADTNTEPIIIPGEYWTEEDKDTLPSNDDNGKFQGMVFRPGVRDANGNDIIIVDAGRLPQRKQFNNKSDYKKVSKSLASYIEVFIHSYVDTHNFVVLVHPGHESRCRFNNSAMGKEIYKMLKNCFSDRLFKCIIYKPEFKLRAFVNLTRPFLKREMRKKISVSRTEQDLEHGFGIPTPVTQCL